MKKMGKPLIFRKLKAHEIDVRTQSITRDGSGAILLLYKDARCDMNILDETVGPLGWKREHKRENANCIVSIYSEEIDEWISKEDTGTESNQDAAKGLASDSFKRACFNWGIGRELYTGPFIYIKKDAVKDLKYARYECKDIAYDEKGSINYLVITSAGKVVYTFGEKIDVEALALKELTDFVNENMKELVAIHGSREAVYALMNLTSEQFIEEYKNNMKSVADRINTLKGGDRKNHDEVIEQTEATEEVKELKV